MGTSYLHSNNFPSILHIKPCKESQSLLFHPRSQVVRISKHEAGCSFPGNGSSQDMIRNSRVAQRDPRSSKMDFAVYCNPQPGAGDLFPFWPHGDSWMSWIVGLLAIIPLLTQRLLKFTKEVEATAETVEKIADAVGKVAEDVEKVAEDISEKLPEGGKLKDVVDVIGDVAEETAKDAQFVEDLMDKVEEVDDKVEFLSTNTDRRDRGSCK